jgi:putative ABC transport system permease protein
MSSNVGVHTDRVAQALVGVSFGRSLGQERRAALVTQLVERLGAQPGVLSAAATASLPPNRTRFSMNFSLPRETSNNATNYLVDTVPVTQALFQTLGIPLVRGRLFTPADAAGRPPVALASVTSARRLFGTRDPIGETLPIGPRDNLGRATPVTIVGVVGDVKYSALDTPPDGAIYRPMAQNPLDAVFLIARTSGSTDRAIAAIRSSIAAVDPGIAVFSTGTLDSLMSEATSQPRFRTVLLGLLAGAALALAGVGLYGVVAFSTAQRSGEIAIRVALGAQPRDVVAMVVGQGLRLSVAGVVLGIAAALALTRTLSALLYGVEPTDVWSFGGAAAALLAVTLAASYVPARRATRIDPLAALRAD